MAKAILESLEGLPDELKSEYTEKDGKFFLNVEPVDGYALDHVEGLKGTLSKEIQNRKGLEAQLAKFKGIDPDKARTALEELEELRKIDPEKEADKVVTSKLEAAKQQLIKKHEAELEAERNRSNQYRSKIEELLLDAEAATQIAALKGSVRVLLPHVRGQTRVVEEDGDFRVEVVGKDGNPRIGNSKGEPMTIAELIAEMRESEDFGRNFEGDGKSGSGKLPGTGHGGTPGLKRSQMTAQQKREYQQKHGQEAFLKLPK